MLNINTNVEVKYLLILVMREMREIALCLTHAYPAMFCDNGNTDVTFKPDKLDTTALKLRERVIKNDLMVTLIKRDCFSYEGS